MSCSISSIIQDEKFVKVYAVLGRTLIKNHYLCTYSFLTLMLIFLKIAPQSFEARWFTKMTIISENC